MIFLLMKVETTDTKIPAPNRYNAMWTRVDVMIIYSCKVCRNGRGSKQEAILSVVCHCFSSQVLCLPSSEMNKCISQKV